MPTTIGGLLSAIGIAGMERVTRFNVLAMSGHAVEAAGEVDTLLLDKTGTITYGNRLAAEILPGGGTSQLDSNGTVFALRGFGAPTSLLESWLVRSHRSSRAVHENRREEQQRSTRAPGPARTLIEAWSVRREPSVCAVDQATSINASPHV